MKFLFQNELQKYKNYSLYKHPCFFWKKINPVLSIQIICTFALMNIPFFVVDKIVQTL